MNHDMQGFFANQRLQRTFILFLFMLSAFIAVLTVNAFKEYRYIGGGVPSANTVTVSGSGEVFAVPDTATFSFSIVEEKENAQAAQEIATEKINSIINFLREGGIEERDIKTVSYNVFPRYEYKQEECFGYRCPPRERVLEGFTVNQTVQVKVRDVDEAGTFLVGIGDRGVSNVSGLAFTVDDEEELKREARQKAINDAEKKARELAKDLGVRVVRVVNFSESGDRPVFAKFGVMESVAMDGAVGASPEIPVGENKITSQVSITYEIQ